VCLILQDGPADVSLAALAAAGSSAAAAAAADAPPLDEDDAAIYKKRIVDLLLPGESVLLALRRLGKWRGAKWVEAGGGGGGEGDVGGRGQYGLFVGRVLLLQELQCWLLRMLTTAACVTIPCSSTVVLGADSACVFPFSQTLCVLY
jgi:hypothetical protein